MLHQNQKAIISVARHSGGKSPCMSKKDGDSKSHDTTPPTSHLIKRDTYADSACSHIPTIHTSSPRQHSLPEDGSHTRTIYSPDTEGWNRQHIYRHLFPSTHTAARTTQQSRRTLKLVKLFVDLRQNSGSIEYVQQIEFLHNVCYNPCHLFEFSDPSIESAYQASRTVQNTQRRILYILILFCVFLPAWVFMWFILREFWTETSRLLPLASLHVWLGLVGVSLALCLTLYVCFVRRHAAARESTSADTLSSAGPLSPRSVGAAASLSAENHSVPAANQDQRGISLVLEVASKAPCEDLQERLKLGGFHSHQLDKKLRSSRRKSLPVPWWIPPEPLIAFCCSEMPLILLFGLLVTIFCIWRVASLYVLCWIGDTMSSRLLRVLLGLYGLSGDWFTLCVFLTSKSLFISPRTCLFLWAFQVMLLCLPLGISHGFFGTTYVEELLCFLLAVSSTCWGFITKIKVDLSSRMFFYIIWRQANRVEAADGATTRTRTGMEDVLMLLSEIERLVTLATAAGPGSLRHTSLTMKILGRISECQALLTRNQDLFKVRVTGDTTTVPFKYATIYGIELGSRADVGSAPPDTARVPAADNATYTARTSLPTRPADVMYSSVVTADAQQRIKDVSGIRDHLLERGYHRKSVGLAEQSQELDMRTMPVAYRYDANEVIQNLQRKVSGPPSPSHSPPRPVRRITWGKPQDVSISTQEDPQRRHLTRIRFRKAHKYPGQPSDSSVATRGSRKRKRRNFPPPRRKSDYDLESEGGGLLLADLPSRKLTESLAGIIGEIWTVDLFDLDAKCDGNILVEVGYALLGKRLSVILTEHPVLIDRNIFHTADGGSRAVRKRSSLVLYGRQSTLLEGVSNVSGLFSKRSTIESQDVNLAGLHSFVLMCFLRCLQEQYRPLPYHNSIHGAHVAHSTVCVVNYLRLPGSPAFTPPVEIAYILAALGHDVGHPGRNNQFFINSYDPLSVIYNDMAVLENFHCCLLFMTLELENCNVLFPFTTEVFREIRELIIKLILATDMKAHFQQLSRFKVRRSDPSFSPYSNADDLKLLLELCIKVGDLASSACTWSVHKDWCFRVVEEFYRQGGEEKELGLPVSPLCDRLKHAQEFAKSQAGFIEFVTAPLYGELRAFDHDGLKQIQQLTCIVAANKTKWESLASGDNGEAESLEVPLHIQEYGKEQTVLANALRSKEKGVDSDGESAKKKRDRYKRRRWRSIVGPISAKPPIPFLESRTRRSKSKRATGDDFTSVEELMTSSNWGEDDDVAGSIILPGGDSGVETSMSFAQHPSQPDMSSAFDESTISLGTTPTDDSMSMTHDWLKSESDGASSSDSSSRPMSSHFKVKMKRDLALSPSARVAPAELPNNAKVLEIIKRRASVLTPID